MHLHYTTLHPSLFLSPTWQEWHIKQNTKYNGAASSSLNWNYQRVNNNYHKKGEKKGKNTHTHTHKQSEPSHSR